MSVQKTVTVEQISPVTPGGNPKAQHYRVTRTRNTVEPAIRQVLTRKEIEDLIDQGTEVVITDRR